VASLSQGRTAAAQCGLFTHKSVPVIFEPPCTYFDCSLTLNPAVSAHMILPTDLTELSPPCRMRVTIKCTTFCSLFPRMVS